MLGRILGALGLLAVLSGCGSLDYTKLTPGALSGSLFVMWIDEGNSSGDGTFLFVPDPNDPLTFTRANQALPGAVIKPGLMYTDGGSIPKVAQVFNGLSPWGYAPAYMIHDWLFVAHHCIVDGEADPRFTQVQGVTFQDSAEILGEAIKALVEARTVKANDVATGAITSAVAGPVAKGLWDTRGACAASHVKPEHAARAAAAIPGVGLAQARSTFRMPPETPALVRTRPAKVVAKVTFH